MIRLIALVFEIYTIGLFVYVILPWINHPGAQSFRKFLDPLYTPILNYIRRFVKNVPVGNTQLDISPLILFVAIEVIKRLVFMVVTLIPSY